MRLFDNFDDSNVDMNYYYNLRKNIRYMYRNDAVINPRVDDLTSQMLQIRDKNHNVEIVDINTKDYVITIGLSEDTTSDDKDKIYNNTKRILEKFIRDNVSLYEKDTSKYEEATNYKLYDDVVVGNTIRFIL